MSTWHLQWVVHGGGGLRSLGHAFKEGCSFSFLHSRSHTSGLSVLTCLHLTAEAKSESYVFVFFRVSLVRGKGKNSKDQMDPPSHPTPILRAHYVLPKLRHCIPNP